MPRVSIRDISRVLLGLTTDAPSDSQPLADEIQLVELLGDSRQQIRPAIRPRMGGGAGNFTAAATRFGVVQLRAGQFPVFVSRFQVVSGFATTWRVGADLIESVRTAETSVWAFPTGAAIVEQGETAAAVVGQSVAAADDFPIEHYLESGEVLSVHSAAAATNLQASFNWVEVP